MKTMNKILVSLCLALWALALSAQTHFSFDYRQYQNDMTIYFMLNSNGKEVSNLDNYEVAAFVGDECRGVATFETQTGSNGTATYGYLRVYSNKTSGETVTFKVYVKSTKEEKELSAPTVTFQSQTVEGMPSNPLEMEFEAETYIPGDANGDGEIDLTDAVLVFDYYMGEEMSDDFIEAAADFDGDGTVDLTDAVLIYEYYMNQ